MIKYTLKLFLLLAVMGCQTEARRESASAVIVDSSAKYYYVGDMSGLRRWKKTQTGDTVSIEVLELMSLPYPSSSISVSTEGNGNSVSIELSGNGNSISIEQK